MPVLTGADTSPQSQSGALTTTVVEQLFDPLEAVIEILTPSGILLMVYPPAPPVTVPALDVRLVASVVTSSAYIMAPASQRMLLMVTVGSGLMVMVNVLALPGQNPLSGLTVMVAVSDPVTWALVKEILPVPASARPMFGLSLVHWRFVPDGAPVNNMFRAVPLQAVTLAGWFRVGTG